MAWRASGGMEAAAVRWGAPPDGCCKTTASRDGSRDTWRRTGAPGTAVARLAPLGLLFGGGAVRSAFISEAHDGCGGSRTMGASFWVCRGCNATASPKRVVRSRTEARGPLLPRCVDEMVAGDAMGDLTATKEVVGVTMAGSPTVGVTPGATAGTVFMEISRAGGDRG